MLMRAQALVCSKCAAGLHDHDRDASTECAGCRPGLYAATADSSGLGSVQCSPCGLGQRPDKGQKACEKCPTNTARPPTPHARAHARVLRPTTVHSYYSVPRGVRGPQKAALTREAPPHTTCTRHVVMPSMAVASRQPLQRVLRIPATRNPEEEDTRAC